MAGIALRVCILFLQGFKILNPYLENMRSVLLFSFNSVKFALVNKVEACAAFAENHLSPFFITPLPQPS
jgi:hypothetical protein